MHDPLLLKLVRWYDHHSPVPRGKRLLYTRALRIQSFADEERILASRQGQRFRVNLRDRLFRDLYFLGEYEPEVSAVARSLLQPGETAVDVGANFGWFTLLFAEAVGSSGQVHSFEPVPSNYEQLVTNLSINGHPSQVRANNVALGDSPGEVVLHVFEGLNQGHASMSSLGRSDYTTYTASLVTLDDYLGGVGRSEVAVLKCDVEGAELAVLRGARSTLSSDWPPLLIIEINETTARAFGFHPEDLLVLLAGYGYEFFRITRRGAVPLATIGDCRHGDNLLCGVPDIHGRRIGTVIDPRLVEH